MEVRSKSLFNEFNDLAAYSYSRQFDASGAAHDEIRDFLSYFIAGSGVFLVLECPKE